MGHSAKQTQDKDRERITVDDLLRALRANGGTASRRTIARAVDAPAWTVARRLQDGIEQGLIQRPATGVYALDDSEIHELLSESAAQIVRALASSGAEAHLTGLDPIAAHAHQFMHGFAHLVYADPDAIDQVAFALSRAGFQPIGPGRQARNLIVHAPDPDRVVVVRGQSPARMDRLGVRSEIAPPEKAWLDLLREVRAGSLPLPLAGVGAILASMLDAGADRKQLKRWAREMGYERQARAVIDRDADPEDDEAQQLVAGAMR